jgi:16S rRNA (guanine(966)-N(2))-methyltransferase RsmD
MMRIITGSARGVRLASLEGEATRPTSERVKEAIFSSIQFDIEGRDVLDLFAGSGQLGLEALSRGAASATFVDSSGEAMAIVKANAKKTGFFESSHFLISDYRSYLRKAAKRDGFHLIFLDPPYASDAVLDALERILSARLAKPGCLIVCESGKPDLLSGRPELAKHFRVIKEARYSITHVTILCYDGEEAAL